MFIETKWAPLVSSGLTVRVLTDFRSLNLMRSIKTVCHNRLKVAQRCKAGQGEEEGAFVRGRSAHWSCLPIPDAPLTIGIEGG